MLAKSVRTMIAALMAVSAGLLVASPPAQAASYRDIKSVQYNRCLYAYGDPLNDIYLRPCSTTPAQYGNWSVANKGTYNGHPLWVLLRQNGKCLGVWGTASNNYLYSSCAITNDRNIWEVFTTTNGRIVLKSFGAFRSWNQHRCLTFPYSGGSGSARLGGCSLTNAANQIYR